MPQASPRPTPLNLDHQFARGAAFSAQNAKHASAKSWAAQLLFWLMWWNGILFHFELNGSVDPYTAEFERSPPVDFYLREKNKQAAIERQEQFRKRVSIRDAVGENVPFAFPKYAAAAQRPPTQAVNDSTEIGRQGILLLLATLLSVTLFIRLLFPGFFKACLKTFKPMDRPGADNGQTEKVRAEDEAFSVFLASFHAGPGATPAPSSIASGGGHPTLDFRTSAQRIIATQRTLLQNINRSTEAPVRRRLLADLGRELQAFKGEAGAPGCLPAWQLASALEGLIKQLCDKAGNVTRSTLRTVEAAVDLLERLCQPTVREDILCNPPVRFLAVDDDTICRTAIAIALKKAFPQPDLAESGATALGLAAKHSYDVIFLDVQLQGMDGFELCSKIHETAPNRETPVVFVTGMNDFDAHAQSVLSGGSDLIGKPFLTFEITLKALTLTLGRRLESFGGNRSAELSPPLVKSDVAGTDEYIVWPDASETDQHTDVISVPQKRASNTDCRHGAIPNATTPVEAEGAMPSADLEAAFLSRTAKQLGALQERLHQLSEANDENTQQELLADLYLRLHALTPEIDTTVNHPALRVTAALEGLLKKLLEDPQHWTSSTYFTIASAVDLLSDLIAVNASGHLTGERPIQILAVDDDLVSRRAIVGALQMAFAKPESAENGLAAVALATQKKFDLIFLDVHMPGLDGFAVCKKIRQTILNQATPVVFVTGQADARTRVRSANCGGNDLIAKPLLMAEVTVKALTFALRGRWEQSTQPQEAKPSFDLSSENLLWKPVASENVNTPGLV